MNINSSNNSTKKILLNILYPLISLIVFVAIWTIVAVVYDKPLLLPDFWQVLKEFFTLLSQGTFYSAVAMTFVRTLGGFLIALVLAFVLAELSALSDIFRRILQPIMVIMRTIPTISVILLLSAWFNSKLTPLFVAVLIACPLLYSAFIIRLTADNEKVTQMLNVFNVGKSTRLLKIYPSILLPQVIRQTSPVMSLTLKVVIAGEVLAYTATSIGMEMYASKLNVETAKLLAWTISAVLLSFVIEGIVYGVKVLLRKFKVTVI